MRTVVGSGRAAATMWARHAPAVSLSVDLPANSSTKPPRTYTPLPHPAHKHPTKTPSSLRCRLGDMCAPSRRLGCALKHLRLARGEVTRKPCRLRIAPPPPAGRVGRRGRRRGLPQWRRRWGDLPIASPPALLGLFECQIQVTGLRYSSCKAWQYHARSNPDIPESRISGKVYPHHPSECVNRPISNLRKESRNIQQI